MHIQGPLQKFFFVKSTKNALKASPLSATKYSKKNILFVFQKIPYGAVIFREGGLWLAIFKRIYNSNNPQSLHLGALFLFHRPCRLCVGYLAARFALLFRLRLPARKSNILRFAKQKGDSLIMSHK